MGGLLLGDVDHGLFVDFPLVAVFPQQFLAKDGDLGLDLFHHVLQGLKGSPSVGGGYKDEKTDFPGPDQAQTVMAVQAAYLEFGEDRFPDLLDLLVGHGPIGGIFHSGDRLSSDLVGPHLTQEYLVGPDLVLRTVLGNGIRDKLGVDAPIYEYVPGLGLHVLEVCPKVRKNWKIPI